MYIYICVYTYIHIIHTYMHTCITLPGPPQLLGGVPKRVAVLLDGRNHDFPVAYDYIIMML